ncbi:MAG: hypothetical protein ACTSXH_03735 [Promethearchaeota archaeon]
MINEYVILKAFNRKEIISGRGEIRTHEGLCHWILSPAPMVLTQFDQIPEWSDFLHFLGNPTL